MDPQIRYVHSGDGTRLATATVGNGPPLLMMMPTGLGSIESLFGIPEWSQTVVAAAERFTFVTYDPRGQGLSDRDDADLSLDARVADLAAVVDALDLPPLNLLGRGLTGPAAIRYTAENPQRVRRLALWAAAAQQRALTLSPRFRLITPFIEVDWPLYCQVLALTDFGWSETARLASEYLQQQISPQTFAKAWQVSRQHDATDLLPQVACPVLVVHPKGSDDRVSFDALRATAALIPNAILRTSDTFSLYWGGGIVDAGVVVDFFSADAAPPAQLPSGTSVIVFTDIADSTALTEGMGDAAFRAASRALDGRIREAMRESGGTPVQGKVLGDGVMAVFPSAAQAIDAADSCLRVSRPTSLKLRVGVHAGDVITESDNVYGGAVNIASRICALSAPGEILVSATVRDLARTSSAVSFEDRGEHALKGIADPIRVFAVRSSE